MGSWSVYCQASKISIVDGEEVVLFPLVRVNDMVRYRWYQEYFPATLPIFGTYSSYGSIDNIIEDENTKLIEKVYGMPIQEWCDAITGQNALPKKLKGIKYCWFLKSVYDFISKDDENMFDSQNSIGSKENLERLGFSLITDEDVIADLQSKQEDYQKKRYKNYYKIGEKYLTSDGRWVNLIENNNVLLYRKDDFIKYFPEINIEELNANHYKFWGENNLRMLSIFLVHNENLSDYFFNIEKLLPDLFKKFSKKLSKIEAAYWVKLIGEKDDFYISGLGDLYTFIVNLKKFSCVFEPMIHYISPQCGEHEEHLKYIKKFAEILESRIRQYNEE